MNNNKNSILAGALYVAATPIGNLSDMTFRAVETLGAVDFVAAEDTRRTGILLKHFGISKPMLSFHKDNARVRGPEIVARLRAGESCALVSDAGTPLVSDPGGEIVAMCHEAGVRVIPLPGACALAAALSACPIPAARFSFEGFLSVTASVRRERLEALASEPRAMVFYEAPHKLKRTLRDLLAAFGDRRITLARELTKVHEEIVTLTLAEACELYSKADPVGEFTLIVEGKPAQQGGFWEGMDVAAHVGYYKSLGHSPMDAVKLAAKDRGVAKSEVYKQTLKKE